MFVIIKKAKETDDKTNILRVTCGKCRTIFETDEWKLNNDNSKYYFYVDCPVCDNRMQFNFC